MRDEFLLFVVNFRSCTSTTTATPSADDSSSISEISAVCVSAAADMICCCCLFYSPAVWLTGGFFFLFTILNNKKIYTCYQKLPERFQQRVCLSAGCWHVEVLTCVSASSGQLKQRGAESDLNPKNYSHVKTLSDVSVSFASFSLIIIIRL